MAFLLCPSEGTTQGASAESGGKGLFIDEQAVTALILPVQPMENETKAAEALKTYLEKMAGVTLEQATFTPENRGRKGAIFLGRAAVEVGGLTKEEMAEAGLEGYRIRVKGGNVYLAGGKYYGTFYGAHYFLECLGAKFYAHDHEVIPPPAKVTIPALNILRKPVFEFRNSKFGSIRLGQHAQDIHAMKPEKIDPDMKTYAHWLHNSLYLVPFYKYGKEHPEYYAQAADGTLYAKGLELKKVDTKLHICMSNPEVRKIAKQRLLEAMNKQNDRRFFSVSQSDGYGWCECKGCLALDSSPGVRTDRLLDFVNDLARNVRDQHPNKLILTFAYCRDTAPAPQRLKPESNVRVLLCPYTPEVKDKAHWFDHQLNREFMPWYQGWVKCLPPGQLYIFDYPYANFFTLSFLHEHHFWRLKQYARDGIRGLYYDSCDRFMYSLFEYVISRLMWDPGLETRPLVEDFIRSYYGPAAPAMQEVYDCLAKIAALDDRSQGGAIDMRKFVTSGECEVLFKHFAKAEDLAKDSAQHLARVKEDKRYLLSTYLEKHNPIMGTVSDMTVFKSRMGEHFTLTLDHINNVDKFNPWLQKVAGLKINDKIVRNDPLAQKLLTDPQSVVYPQRRRRDNIATLTDAKGWHLLLGMSAGAKSIRSHQSDCPRRENVYALHSRATEYSLMRLYFDLPEDPGEAALAIEALDDAKPGKTRIRMVLNDKELFRGPNQFTEKDWSTCRYEISKRTLIKGKNELVIENLEEGGDQSAQWVMVADVRIETVRPVAIPPAQTLFLVHFDKGFDADVGAIPEAQTAGDVKIHPEGKWGGALDADYTELERWSLRYRGLDNYKPSQGTAEMWVKPKYSPGSPEDKNYVVFISIAPDTVSDNVGMSFTKAAGSSILTFCTDQTTPAALPLKWQLQTWHHLAVTWDNARKTVQIFADGVLLGKGPGRMGPDMVAGIHVGNLHGARGRKAGMLIDELRISDQVLWEGKTVGEKVFELSDKPYSKTE